jgi:hypothetical protein
MNTVAIIGIVAAIVILISISIVLLVMFMGKKNVIPTTTIQPTQAPGTAPGTAPGAAPAVQPEPTPPPLQSIPALINFVRDTNKQIAWKGMTYKTDQDMRGLDYLVGCNAPWNAYYKIGCTLPDGKTMYTNPYGPVSYKNYQGPDIRIAPEGKDNYCVQMGGKLSVIRQRPGDKEMLDITDFLQNDDTTGPYNGIDPVFVDNYNTDC